jgi:hypothetical protein
VRSLIALLSLALLACPACVHKPTMHLNHAEITGVQVTPIPPTFNIVMTVVVDVYNPNGYDVAVRAMRGQTIMAGYSMPVDYRAPGDGLWLPSGQTTSVRVPLNIPLPLALSALQQAAMSPTIPYRFVGTADVTATRSLQIEKDNYSVDETGEVTREQLAAVIPASIPH